MVRKALLGAVLLLALVASPAAAQYDGFVVSPGTVTQGGTVTVSGQACEPGEVVKITLQPTAGDPIQVAEVKADERGNYTTSFVVPADLPPGEYLVKASCGTGVDGKTITVVAAGTATTAPPVTKPKNNQGTGSKKASKGANSGKLARTGSDLDRVGLVGAGLLMAGGLLLVATKRRRHAGGIAA